MLPRAWTWLFPARSGVSHRFRSKVCGWRGIGCLWTHRKPRVSWASPMDRLKERSSARSGGTKQTGMWPRATRMQWRARMRRRRTARSMNILVMFAVEAEFAPWRNRRKFRRLPGDRPRFEAQFGGAHVRAVLTGMGQTQALEAARRALPDRPDICISTGLAGALRREYRPGDILAARLVSEVGEPVAVASHPELLTTAVDCGARQVERFATSPPVVACAEEKLRLGTQAAAGGIESYTILAGAAPPGVAAVA